MEIYLAPLQGYTDWIFREAFSEHIGHFDKTFSPFIRIQQGEFYRPNQCNDILPEHNTFQKPVPQFLGNDISSFQRFEELCHENRYDEMNINMGCPFPVVVNKGMGAGMLLHPDRIEKLLQGIFATTKLNISIKCRLGQDSVAEFEQLIPIFNNFPLYEIIIHPRVGKQQYKGEVDLDSFAGYASMLKHPVCYNGNILSIADVVKIHAISPQVNRLMIGRGILQNPFLLAAIKEQKITHDEKVRMLRNFHLSVIELCKQKYSGDIHIIKRMEEFWAYHAEGFEDGRKIYKQLKKCTTLTKYEGVILSAINNM